jgi:ketosteroid isomerase-like protein
MSQDLRDIALAYLDCVSRIDTAAMRDHYAPGATVWLPGQGWMEPSGLTALLEGARSLLVDGIKFAHEEALVDGNRVVVMTTCDSPLVKGGAYVNQFCFVFTFDEDGKISELREYTDSGPAIAAFHS